MLSCVIPTLNATDTLRRCLDAVAGADEIVIADGGSVDGTMDLPRSQKATCVHTKAGRGRQLAAGIAAARGDWLLLLHADTILGREWHREAVAFMAEGDSRAAYFRFRLDSGARQARRLERLVAWRCRTLGLPYGDQGLLLSRRLLDDVGGMPQVPLMEDVMLVRRIGRGSLICLPSDATTSAARWERDGYMARSARNVGCLALYFLGVPPRWIVRLYA